MSTKKYKILQTPIGMGKVYKDDKFIANVRYKLQIRQEFIVIKSSSGEGEIPGLKEVTGQISVIEGERFLKLRSVLTLHLDDGRKWKFLIERIDPSSAMYSAVNSSAEDLMI